MLNLIRSTVFAVLMSITILLYSLVVLVTFPLKPMARYAALSGWAKMMMKTLIPGVLGIRYRVIGLENLPDTPAVFLCKHQSAWETIALQAICPPIAFVLKRELLRIPFFGWGLACMPNISIDRAASKDALNQVINQGKERIAEGLCVVIFPEGTRVAPGEKKRYKVGGAALAVEAGVKAIPIAHNAGEFWRKNAFVKRPGEVVVSIGPAIDTTGLTPEAVNAQVETWIENEMQRQFPHLYANKSPEIITAS